MRENGRQMSISIGGTSRHHGALLLADISGYTGFLQGVTQAHRDKFIDTDEPPQAYTFISTLLDAVTTALSPAFELVKLEGDAVFAVAPDGPLAPRGASVTTCMRACYAAFSQRLAAAGQDWTCTCNSCARITGLDLKFVLHHGEYMTQRILGREELAGPDVIVAHRLLKNHARDVVGAVPYALLTDAALRAMDVPDEGMTALTETYEDLPPIPAHVLPLA
jgi:hypothetical protein